MGGKWHPWARGLVNMYVLWKRTEHLKTSTKGKEYFAFDPRS